MVYPHELRTCTFHEDAQRQPKCCNHGQHRDDGEVQYGCKDGFYAGMCWPKALMLRWTEDLWIHDMIWLKKTPARIDAKTGMIALRPIGVYCPINGALEYPAYWCEESPNMTTMTTEIASDAKYMIISDAKDGYHAIVVTVDEGSRKYLALGYYSVKYKKFRLFVPTCMPQGLGPAGVFYPAWCHHHFNLVLGLWWRQMWRDHIDDVLIFLSTFKSC